MITCPWCGTNYAVFQSNCQNCGGPLPAVEGTTGSSVSSDILPTPPPAPRPISNRYVWRLLTSDGGAIAAFVIGLLGLIFSLVGAGLTIGIITAFVGVPFLLLGVTLLGTGAGVFLWRYQQKQQVVKVLREGEATIGKILEISENFSVSINGRHPWILRYQYQVNGQSQDGKVATLNQPGQPLQVGKAVRVLYLAAAPKWSSIYPHP